MTKSEFIDWLYRQQKQLDNKLDSSSVEQVVNTILESVSDSLASGERVEIRGFGSFSLHYRLERIGRNPKTGDKVSIPARYVPYFKPGKMLREGVNNPSASDPT